MTSLTLNLMLAYYIVNVNIDSNNINKTTQGVVDKVDRFSALSKKCLDEVMNSPVPDYKICVEAQQSKINLSGQVDFADRYLAEKVMFANSNLQKARLRYAKNKCDLSDIF